MYHELGSGALGPPGGNMGLTSLLKKVMTHPLVHSPNSIAPSPGLPTEVSPSWRVRKSR